MAASRRKFIHWVKSEETVKKEAEMVAQEQGAHLVKVVLQDTGDDAMVYREGRKGLRYQALTNEELAMMGNDNRAFFVARWDNEDVKWNLLRRETTASW